ncbi:PREDICTED: 5-formyltetrahydrofolate cyclo-ligase, mitochondrial isoform X2 [Tarenaya hassleriana]|uniref:5-formyltetrahydrofolate cyclo-ligase, mitochondrial isoform X2 n=1 Tax=Tarenaya hassleriana TaxID=28532 RepID=UPI00053C4D7A|nr:PREDICTED: 5-formyltetrahydrofolate cyclo-ligase, mitochondrial isoform X2 [Tarenaya hassleriana]
MSKHNSAQMIGACVFHIAATLPKSSLFFPKISTRPVFSSPPRSRPVIRAGVAMTTTTSTTTDIGSDKDREELESVFKQKRVVRSSVRRTLKSMDPSLRSQEDDAIQKIVVESSWFRSCCRLCAYISCRSLNEVDTSQILSEILQNRDANIEASKKLYVPRVEDKNSNMRMLHISQMDDLIANSMNILEPAPVDAKGNEREEVMQTDEPIDLFILPGLAFDRSGRRLGRGGGYYDTFLRRYHDLAQEKKWRKPLLVALSYSPQILDEGTIPMTPSDVLIDALVTPSGVVPISPAAFERM